MTFRFWFVCAAFVLALTMLTGYSMRTTSTQREEMIDNILALSGHLLLTQPPGTPFTNWEAVADRVSKVPGVRVTVPIVEGQALTSSPFNASSVLVRGIRARDLIKLTSVAMNIRQGTLDGFDEGQGIVVGSRLSKQLSLQAGDSITLVALRGGVTRIGASPRAKNYKIAAVFENGMPELDAGFVFMPLMEAQSYFDRFGDVTEIEIHLGEADSVDAFRQRVTEAAGRPIVVTDWRQRNATYFDTR